MPGLTNKSTMWSGTQFNIKAFADQQNAAAQLRWTCLGQLEECPETKRQHYQFAIKTPHVRMSQVVKVFPGAHIEVCRNKDALLQYVVKEETRVGDLPEVSDLFPSLDATLIMFCKWAMTKNIPYDREGQRIRLNGQAWLDYFDEWVDHVAIPKEKLRVESIAVNPATRSLIKKYMNGIYGRTMLEREEKRLLEAKAEGPKLHGGQTDRQTAQEIVSPRGITSDGQFTSSSDDSEAEREEDASESWTEDEEDEGSSYEGTDASSESYSESKD